MTYWHIYQPHLNNFIDSLHLIDLPPLIVLQNYTTPINNHRTLFAPYSFIEGSSFRVRIGNSLIFIHINVRIYEAHMGFS